MTYLNKIDEIPNSPGIYIFNDVNNNVLYVGTSGNLRTRIKNHFKRVDNVNLLEISSIRYWIINGISTSERIKLEKAFIKKFQPKYNQNLKDILAKNEDSILSIPSYDESHIIFFDLPEQSRDDLLVRIKNEAFYILSLTLQFEMLGITTKGKNILVQHCKDLLNLSNDI